MKQPPPETSPDGVVAEALNEQGFLFQHRVIEELAVLKPRDQHSHNWMVEATEVPVSLANESETRIDVLLKHHGSRESPWYGILECKRMMKEYKRWVFFAEASRDHQPSAGNYYVEHGDLNGGWDHQGQAPMMHRLEISAAPVDHRAFDFYLEARLDRPGSGKTVSATTAIESALQQVTLGQAGLAGRLRATNVLKFRLIPIIVTTAELMAARYDSTKVTLDHGKIEPANLKLEAQNWVAVNYRVNDVVCQHSQFTTYHSQDIGVDIAARHVRTVFIVQAAHLHEFLAWLARLFKCF